MLSVAKNTSGSLVAGIAKEFSALFWEVGILSMFPCEELVPALHSSMNVFVELFHSCVFREMDLFLFAGSLAVHGFQCAVVFKQ